MLFLLLTCFILIIPISFYVLFSFRYESNIFRRFILKKITEADQIQFLDSDSDISTIRSILEYSMDKGNGLEANIALPAWYPLYNIESVDGDLWKRMKKNLHKVISKLNLKNITKLSEKYTTVLLMSNRLITSKDFSIIPAQIYYELIFNEQLDVNEIEMFYTASIEWRKEIAVKGKGDIKIKKQFFDFFCKKLKSEDREVISVYAQPFFISPMINFSDIFVAIFKNREYFISHNTVNFNNIVLESIRLYHPFPILERKYDLKDNHTYHSYIELDNFKQDRTFEPSRWNNKDKNIYEFIPFGIGSRRCTGKNIALETISAILKTMVFYPGINWSLICPEKDHVFSGRDNDLSTSFDEISYQLRFVLRIITDKLK